MKLYFVRHGRTLWNQEGRFQGASGDSPLLPESIETLKRLGQYLKEIPFDQIYSSDLPRAVKSAEIIQSQLHTPCSLEIVPNLREWQPWKLFTRNKSRLFVQILLNLTLECSEPNPSIVQLSGPSNLSNH